MRKTKEEKKFLIKMYWMKVIKKLRMGRGGGRNIWGGKGEFLEVLVLP